MESMTGYGRAEIARGSLKVIAEVKSVNNRYLDVKTRVPPELNPWEPSMRALIRESISRGSVQASIFVERGSAIPPCINFEAARRVTADLKRLQRNLGLPGEIDISLLSRFPQVMGQVSAELDEASLRAAAGAALGKAMSALGKARRTEGAAIRKDLLAHLTILSGIVRAIARKAPGALRNLSRALADRTRDIVGSSVDPRRIAEEAALLASRRDFTEELNRLATHLVALKKLLNQAGPVGRNLEFQTQEILRELTTVASKAPGTEIIPLTVEARVELEKIKEQVYNIE
jgi:uncharacterized protein (TIGR00255 family)